jgi:hypothetical protein
MNVSIEERLHDYGPRLDEAIASYVDRSHDRVVPASLLEPATSKRHAGARSRSTALVAGALAIAIILGTTILATRQTPEHPPSHTSTPTTIGLHTINGKTFGPMPPSRGQVSLSERYAEAPDFVAVLRPDGVGVAGYIKKTDLFPLYNGQHVPGGPIMPVYADGGSPLVGHFYQCKGFVALSENPAHVPNRCPPPTVITH